MTKKKHYYMMGMGRYYAAKRKLQQDLSNGLSGDLDSSPVKTVLGSLAVGKKSHYNQVTSKTHARHTDLGKAPSNIEDVPFRRQDRRILNARNKRVTDRKLIIFIVLLGLLLLGIGAGFIVVYFIYHDDNNPTSHNSKVVKPFLILGPVVAGVGLLTMLFSVEVCVRLVKAKRRVQDPELDNLVNLHEVKHWVDPNIVPYGWGLYTEGSDEVLAVDIAGSNHQLGGGRALSSRAHSEGVSVGGRGHSEGVSTGGRGHSEGVSIADIENQADQLEDRLDNESREVHSLADSPHRYGRSVLGDGGRNSIQ